MIIIVVLEYSCFSHGRQENYKISKRFGESIKKANKEYAEVKDVLHNYEIKANICGCNTPHKEDNLENPTGIIEKESN